MQKATAIKVLKAITYVGVYGGLLMPVFFWPAVIFPFVYSKLSFFQVLIGLTFPAYVALAWAEPKYRPRFSVLFIAICAYFLALAASVVFSVDPLRSWWGNQERMNGLFTLLHFLAWLGMTIGTIRTWPQWRRLLNYQIGLSAFMAVVALLQKPFPRLLMFPAGERVGGLLDNPIYMAAYQIFSFYFIALLWLKGPTSRAAKIWYAFALLLDIGAFLAAQSRGALVGLAAGIVVFAVAYAIMTPSRKARRIVLAAVVCCFAGYGLLFAMRNVSFIRNSPLSRLTNLNASTETRFIAWRIAWHGFLDRPITGWGLDAFHVLFNAKYNPESLHYGYYETWFDRSHNTVMDVLSMTGLFGFVTFAAIFVTLYMTVIRAYRRKWIDVTMASILIGLPVAYFVQNVFVFDHPAMFSMSFLMYALVIAAGSPHFSSLDENRTDKGEPGKAEKTEKARNVPWVAFGVLQAVMLLVVWQTTIMPVRASMLSIDSNNAFSGGQLDKAYAYAKRAADIWTPYLDEQTFLQSRNFITLAQSGSLQRIPFWRDWHDLIIRISEKQDADHMSNANPHFIYARFAEAFVPYVPEDAAIAEREYRKSIELSPQRQQVLWGFAHFLISRGRQDEALDILKQVVSLDDQLGEAHWQLGLHLFFDRQQFEDGAKELVKAYRSKYPYIPSTAREAMALAYAFDALSDAEGLKAVMTMLPTLPQGDVGTYLEIAKTMERQGLIQERNMILNALVRMDSSVAARLQPLVNGSVTSIQDALKKTEAVPQSTSTPVSTTASTTTQVATTSVRGPRLK